MTIKIISLIIVTELMIQLVVVKTLLAIRDDARKAAKKAREAEQLAHDSINIAESQLRVHSELRNGPRIFG